MPEILPWARVLGDVNANVRRGAWYEVIRLTPEAALLDVNRQLLSVPRSSLEITHARPFQWSVVPRPHDAVDLPISWGSRYGVCPHCSHRTALKGQPSKLLCPRCGGLFSIPLE